MNENLPNPQQVVFTWKDFTAEICLDKASLQTAYALRYRAYRAVNAIDPAENESCSDPYDQEAHTRTHLIWYQDQPVASVRSCIWSDKYRWQATEGIQAFWQDIHRNLGLQHRILESNRYVVDPTFNGRKSLIAQLLMFRLHAISSELETCAFIATAVRPKHVPFYERMLGFRQISEVIHLPWVRAPIVMLITSRTRSLQIALERGMPPYTREDVRRYQSILEQFNSPVL